MKHSNCVHLLIKEVSTQVKVPVGTLLYYDSVGLLKPHLRSSGGYRLYSHQDILKLEQIRFLKNLGFGLSKIKKLLQQKLPPDTLESLRTQARELQAQVLKTQTAHDTLNFATHEYEKSNAINWEQLLQHKNNLGLVNEQEIWWSDLSLDNNLRLELLNCQDRLTKLFHLDKKSYDHLWLGLITEVSNNLTKNPADEIGKDLGTRAIGLLRMLYGKNDKLCWGIYAASQQQNYILRPGLTPKITTWLKRAIEVHNIYQSPTE